MILDKNVRFADAAATGATGTRVIGDVIDLQAASRDIGVGQPVYARGVVETAIAAGAGGTITFQIVSADDAALTTNPIIHFATAALNAAAGIAAGTVLFDVALPSNGTGYGRYLGIREVVATANTTAGKIDAFLLHDQIAYRAYRQGQVQP